MQTLNDILFRSRSPLVALEQDLRALPFFECDPSIDIREMDFSDAEHIGRWIKIHNAAFGRNWGLEEFRNAMTDNRVVRVIKTYFVGSNGVPVGTASIGCYKSKPEVGLGHYLCLMPDARGKGLGKYLAHFRYAELKKLNFTRAESETRLHCGRSIFIHFDLGFKPKIKMDAWNSTDGPALIPRSVANFRLNRIFSHWMRNHDLSTRSPRPS